MPQLLPERRKNLIEAIKNDANKWVYNLEDIKKKAI